MDGVVLSINGAPLTVSQLLFAAELERPIYVATRAPSN